MTDDETDLPVRELIALLAQVEDAIADTPPFTRPAHHGAAPTHPDLLALLTREQHLIAQLRRHPTRPAADPDLFAGRRP